jgi:hypothetical protein
MQTLYCWRCRTEMPMLDEQEWATISPLLRRSLADTKEERARTDVPLSSSLVERHFRPALEEYARLTGYVETNSNAVWHHRLSLYGAACPSCGKPFRTPAAKLCVSCGYRKPESQWL